MKNVAQKDSQKVRDTTVKVLVTANENIKVSKVLRNFVVELLKVKVHFYVKMAVN